MPRVIDYGNRGLKCATAFFHASRLRINAWRLIRIVTYIRNRAIFVSFVSFLSIILNYLFRNNTWVNPFANLSNNVGKLERVKSRLERERNLSSSFEINWINIDTRRSLSERILTNTIYLKKRNNISLEYKWKFGEVFVCIELHSTCRQFSTLLT